MTATLSAAEVNDIRRYAPDLCASHEQLRAERDAAVGALVECVEWMRQRPVTWENSLNRAMIAAYTALMARARAALQTATPDA